MSELSHEKQGSKTLFVYFGESKESSPDISSQNAVSITTPHAAN